MQVKIVLLVILSWVTCQTSFSQGQPTPRQNFAAHVKKIIEEQNKVEEAPVYSGGFEALYDYIQHNLKYPRKARKSGKQGKVVVSFVIDRIDGHVRDVSIVIGADQLLNKEAIRLIKAMPNWIPGKQSGRNVNVQLSMPVSFVLE